MHGGSFDNVFIPTYIINLPERTERREHIVKQFSGRTEFDTVIVDACRHEIGAVGLWRSIISIIKMAVDNDDDVIVICEDDHEFTEHYNREVFIRNIIEANAQGVDYLSGGTGYFYLAVQVSEHRFWVNPSSATQFIVIYKRFFDKILNEPYNDNVIADVLLSGMTGNKMVMYPFISRQRDFGYSDVTPVHNNMPGLVDCLFSESSRKLGMLKDTAWKFCQKKSLTLDPSK
ncbi:glycosyl transferase [Chitinophaga polysaccharea]|nr:glycosyl transferase [Chitinophaga polysaccharea]NLU91459.1 glycosyl transferase [Chitinophaga sp. Ak27]